MDLLSLIEVFDRSFSPQFQIETLKLLNALYKESKLQVSPPECTEIRGRVLRPQIRVEKFNVRWSELARKSGLKADSYPNSTNTYPVELIEGKEMMLTAKLVDRPYKVPRDVLYIRQLASNNPSVEQLNILNQEKDRSPEPHTIISLKEFKQSKTSLAGKSKRYGVLVHGHSQSTEPDFAQILIPNSTCSHWLAVIDLMSRYSKFLAVPEEEIIEIKQPIIRRKDQGDQTS